MVKTIPIPEKYWPKGAEERGDVYDVFKALSNWAKDKKLSRLESFNEAEEELLKSQPQISDYMRYTQYHCSFNYWIGVNKRRIDYYPSTGRWKDRNKMYNGGLAAMLGRLKKGFR